MVDVFSVNAFCINSEDPDHTPCCVSSETGSTLLASIPKNGFQSIKS